MSPTKPKFERYDGTTRLLHWATAGLVTTLWTMGRLTMLLPKGALRLDLWSVHILLGMTLGATILIRIAWRLTGGRTLSPSGHDALHVAAKAMHAALYVLLLAVVSLGALNILAHGFPLFGMWYFPKIGDENYAKVVNGWHNLCANIIAFAALLHALAALVHHHVLKDPVLDRMWPGRSPRS